MPATERSFVMTRSRATLVVATLADQDVRPTLIGANEFEVHRSNRPMVRLVDLSQGSSARFHVAPDPAKDVKVGVGVDEDLHLEAGCSDDRSGNEKSETVVLSRTAGS